MLKEHPDSDRFNFIRSERTLFEILPKGVNKGLAVKRLANYLNIDVKRTIAVGDYDNDASMLRAAGCGIAVVVVVAHNVLFISKNFAVSMLALSI